MKASKPTGLPDGVKAVPNYEIDVSFFNKPFSQSRLNDIYGDDGYVYTQRFKRRGKWFKRMMERNTSRMTREESYRLPTRYHRIWAPKLKDIIALEEKRWQICQKLSRENEIIWLNTHKLLISAGNFSGYRGTVGDKERKVVFTKQTYNHGGFRDSTGISWGWEENVKTRSKEEIDVPLNQPLTDLYFSTDEAISRNRHRIYMFQYAFLMAIHEQYFRSSDYNPDAPRKTVVLNINNRQYIFRSPSTNKNSSDYYYGSRGEAFPFDVLMFPEDVTQTETLTKSKP